MNKIIENFNKITSLENLPDDSEENKLNKKFLILMAIFMSFGGILWGSICLVYGLHIPMLIPYSYTVVSFINISLFSIFKKFQITRTIQVFISLFLPFLF